MRHEHDGKPESWFCLLAATGLAIIALPIGMLIAALLGGTQ